MSNGIWSGGKGSESLQQAGLTRHRLLRVNCGSSNAVAWQLGDSSGNASLDPNTIAPNTHNTVTDKGPEGGPHFVMSPQTPDGSPHSYGFEFVLFLNGIAAGAQAAAAAGDYTVTVWELVSTTQYPEGGGTTTAFTPVWAAFNVQTGVGLRQAWHSFDCNATALRFQIGNLALDPTANNRSIYIAFAEL